MATTNSPVEKSSGQIPDSLRLGRAAAEGSLGFYEQFPSPATPPPLSSTRSDPPPRPTKNPLRLPTPPATPRPLDISILRVSMELEALKLRVDELERRLAMRARKEEEDDEPARCDCSLCVMGFA